MYFLLPLRPLQSLQVLVVFHPRCRRHIKGESMVLAPVSGVIVGQACSHRSQSVSGLLSYHLALPL